MIKGKKLLVFSAHAADFVWRSGGTIAKYIAGGADVCVVLLSMGVRGESNFLWKDPANQTYENVESLRKYETMNAARTLGLTEDNIEFWGYQDYPIPITDELRERILRKIREFRPDFIITHDKEDVLNPDHNAISELVWQCSVFSNSAGVIVDDLKVTKQMQIYGFEPHQTEISSFVPDIFIDITDFFEQKVRAMKCFEAQHHLIEIYTQRAILRGNHCARLSGKSQYKYGECFGRRYPLVSEELL